MRGFYPPSGGLSNELIPTFCLVTKSRQKLAGGRTHCVFPCWYFPSEKPYFSNLPHKERRRRPEGDTSCAAWVECIAVYVV